MLLSLFEQVEKDQLLRSEMIVQSSPSSSRTELTNYNALMLACSCGRKQNKTKQRRNACVARTKEMDE